MQQKRIVLDIDGTIAINMGTFKPEEQLQTYRDEYGAAFIERHTITALNVPHLIYPGYYALLRWLHQQGWAIDFFSSGVEQRNRELVDELMQRSFGAELATVPYRVFSRQHAIDTDALDLRSKDGDGGNIYQSHFYGQRKKKLAGVVVAESDVAHTLLVDDDNSYMTAGEEKNFISLHYSYEYPRKRYHAEDPKRFQIMHNAYYLAALLEAVATRAEQAQLPLTETAYQIQVTDFGAELNKELYCYPSLQQTDFYHKGLALLQTIEPDLTFYLGKI